MKCLPLYSWISKCKRDSSTLHPHSQLMIPGDSTQVIVMNSSQAFMFSLLLFPLTSHLVLGVRELVLCHYICGFKFSNSKAKNFDVLNLWFL